MFILQSLLMNANPVLLKICRSLSDQFYPYIATTQPTTQNKAKQLGWCGIIIGKKTTTPPPGIITFKPLPGNLES